MSVNREKIHESSDILAKKMEKPGGVTKTNRDKLVEITNGMLNDPVDRMTSEVILEEKE